MEMLRIYAFTYATTFPGFVGFSIGHFILKQKKIERKARKIK